MKPGTGWSLGRGRRSLSGAAAVLLTFCVAACGAAGVSPPPAPSPISTGSNDGLSLSARLDRPSVEPGGKVTIEVSIHNGRTTPVTYSVMCDSATTMVTTLPFLREPAGKTWSGIEADFKEAALGRSSLDGYTGNEMQTTTRSGSCDGFEGERTLDPGGTIKSILVWTADLVSSVHAVPGDVPFTITFEYDPTGGPSSYAPGRTGLIGTWTRQYQQLKVTGHIQIVGQAPSLLSKGQVIDAVLADSRFEKWLSEQPENTWSTMNVLLQNYGATSIVPAGPNWELELFRELGVPRNYAMAFVDPFTGAVNLNFCEAPCSR